MATNTKFSLVLPLVLVISMAMFSILAAKADDELKETKMSVYIHDYASGGTNSTDLAVVGFPGKLWTFTQFGTLFVSDDLITEEPDPKSAPVGRGQGISVTASLDGIHAYVSLSIVFTNEAYNGSTIQIQGNGNQFMAVREYGVVSGTGKFRYAGGYVTMENYFFDPSANLHTDYPLEEYVAPPSLGKSKAPLYILVARSDKVRWPVNSKLPFKNGNNQRCIDL